ncbi:MAG: hypothetical protein RLZZ292_2010 [Bacteroidota bacterium]
MAIPRITDSKSVLLLGDKTEIPVDGYVSSQRFAYGIRVKVSNDPSGDTLKNIVTFSAENRIIFIKKEPKGTKQYSAKSLKPYTYTPFFLNGYCVIVKENGKQNALDENLNEVLKEDAKEITVLAKNTSTCSNYQIATYYIMSILKLE